MTKTSSEFPVQPKRLLEEANLRYVSDAEPGYGRRRHGRGFVYLDPEGHIVQNATLRQRFQVLKIPPAWQDVWICADADGHLQATGRDEAGRKQYLYHPDWETVREQTKFARLLEFGEALPGLRIQVEADLRSRGLSARKVVALVVRLLEKTLIRIGNQEYERQNSTYGLTTLHDDHVEINGSEISFEFRGKRGIDHEIVLDDPRLARLVKACQELPGQRLFQYLDEGGAVRAVDSGAVNDYLRNVTGCAFTAKEFRTWGGTLQALRILRALGEADSPTAYKRRVAKAVKTVAAHLGNTAAVCRQHYIHPCVIECYTAGRLERFCARLERRIASTPDNLQGEEAILLALLRRYARKNRQTSTQA